MNLTFFKFFILSLTKLQNLLIMKSINQSINGLNYRLSSIKMSGKCPFSLGTLVPNLTSSQVTVSYDASSATSAYLVITNTLTAGSENYILNTNSNQISVNLSNYSSGIYTVTLVCDGAIVDSKSLIKN